MKVTGDEADGKMCVCHSPVQVTALTIAASNPKPKRSPRTGTLRETTAGCNVTVVVFDAERRGDDDRHRNKDARARTCFSFCSRYLSVSSELAQIHGCSAWMHGQVL